MSLFSVLKRNSKRALQGNWGQAIAVMLLGSAISLVLYVMQSATLNLLVDPVDLDPTFALQYGFNDALFQRFAEASLMELGVSTGFMLLGLFLLAPLGLGMVHWYYRLVQGKPQTFTGIFRYFETARGYRRSLWLEINIGIRSLLWALVFYAVPVVLFAGCTYVTTRSEEAGRLGLTLASAGLFLSAILFLLASVFYAALLNKYMLAAFLLVEDDDLGVRAAIAQSARYTKGYRFSLLLYQLSFIGWILLCVFFFPALYVVPYHRTAMTMYARYIIEKGRAQPPEPTRVFDTPPPPANSEGKTAPPRVEATPAWPRFDALSDRPPTAAPREQERYPDPPSGDSEQEKKDTE